MVGHGLPMFFGDFRTQCGRFEHGDEPLVRVLEGTLNREAASRAASSAQLGGMVTGCPGGCPLGSHALGRPGV